MAEEPKRSGLDVDGLKGEVLRRVSKLEKRSRERQEILAEVVPLMEVRGYDAGAVKTALGA